MLYFCFRCGSEENNRQWLVISMLAFSVFALQLEVSVEHPICRKWRWRNVVGKMLNDFCEGILHVYFLVKRLFYLFGAVNAFYQPDKISKLRLIYKGSIDFEDFS